MAGVKGMFEGRRQSPAYVNAVRSRIRAGGIVDRLEKYILGKLEMSPAQVTAALGLLRKVVPDVAHVEHTGEINHNYVARTPLIAESTEAWQEQHSPATIQ